MSDSEPINNFIKQLPKLNEVMNGLKEQSEGDVVKKYELEKQVEMTNEMKNINYEELKGYLEKKYDQMNEIQINKENENKERNKCFESINQGLEVINQLKSMSENMKYIEEYDSINMNNVNIMMNKVVDMMISNETNEEEKEINAIKTKHSNIISEMNKMRKQTLTNELIDVKLGAKNKKKINNEFITNNIQTLET